MILVSCFSKIQTGFTFLVPAHPSSPVQNLESRKTVVVVVSFIDVTYCLSFCYILLFHYHNFNSYGVLYYSFLLLTLNLCDSIGGLYSAESVDSTT